MTFVDVNEDFRTLCIFPPNSRTPQSRHHRPARTCRQNLSKKMMARRNPTPHYQQLQIARFAFYSAKNRGNLRHPQLLKASSDLYLSKESYRHSRLPFEFTVLCFPIGASMMMLPDKYSNERPHRLQTESLGQSIDQPGNPSVEMLERIAARRAVMERAGFGSCDQHSPDRSIPESAQARQSELYPSSESTFSNRAESKILNYALKLESLDTERSSQPPPGKPSPGIRFTVGAILFGVTAHQSKNIECRIVMHVQDNPALETSREPKPYPAASARASRTNRHQAPNAHKPRRSPSRTPGSRKRLTFISHPHARSARDEPLRRPRRHHTR